MTGADAKPSSADTASNYGSFTAHVVGNTLKLTVKAGGTGPGKANLSITNGKGTPIPGTIYEDVNGVVDKIYLNFKTGSNSLEAIVR